MKLLWEPPTALQTLATARVRRRTDPEVFSWAATQVVTAMEATHKLGGENYVLWGGRGRLRNAVKYRLASGREQLGRFMQMVVEHKHKIGFQGHVAYRTRNRRTD